MPRRSAYSSTAPHACHKQTARHARPRPCARPVICEPEADRLARAPSKAAKTGCPESSTNDQHKRAPRCCWPRSNLGAQLCSVTRKPPRGCAGYPKGGRRIFDRQQDRVSGCLQGGNEPRHGQPIYCVFKRHDDSQIMQPVVHIDDDT